MPKPTSRWKTGGYKRFMRAAKNAESRSVNGIDVGFFSTARYPPVRTGKNGGQPQTPHYVATVAAWQEFGTSNGVPERPFFRNAIRDASGRKGPLVQIMINSIDPKTMVFDEKTAGKIGATMVGIHSAINHYAPRTRQRSRHNQGRNRPDEDREVHPYSGERAPAILS